MANQNLILNERDTGGLHVTLSYHTGTQACVVTIDDTLTGDWDAFRVPNDKAQDAFWHPYVYAHDIHKRRVDHLIAERNTHA